MLKGHTLIQLTNVKTGEVEQIENHNLITNACSDIINNYIKRFGVNAANTDMLPLNEKGMGGILLFENELTEDANNILIPANNPITGYASANVNEGTDTKRGSRNLTESEKLVNGYKFVWDFSTSQANGQISAVALTNAKTGINPYTGSKASFISSSSSYFRDRANVISQLPGYGGKDEPQYICSHMVDFDFDNGIMTCIVTNSTTEIIVYKYRVYLNTIGVNDKLNGFELISNETIDLSSSGITLDGGDKKWTKGNDGYYYYTYAVNTTVYVVRIDDSDYSIDTGFGKLSFTTQYVCSTDTFAYNYSMWTDPITPIVMNGHMYLIANKSNTLAICKVNLSDTSDIMYGETLGNTWALVTQLGNQIIYRNYIINEDLSIIECPDITTNNMTYANVSIYQDAGNGNYCINNKGEFITVAKVQNQGTYIVYDHFKNYMATINNLGGTVEKTSDKVMKVIYTITEV